MNTTEFYKQMHAQLSEVDTVVIFNAWMFFIDLLVFCTLISIYWGEPGEQKEIRWRTTQLNNILDTLETERQDRLERITCCPPPPYQNTGLPNAS